MFDTNYIKLAIDLIIERTDITTLKLASITTLLTRLTYLHHTYTPSKFQTAVDYFFNLFDTLTPISNPELKELTFYYTTYLTNYNSLKNTPNYLNLFTDALMCKVNAYQLMTETQVCLTLQYIHLLSFTLRPVTISGYQVIIAYPLSKSIKSVIRTFIK